MQDDLEPAPLSGRDMLDLGALLVGCIVGCTLLGMLVDHLAGSSPVGVVVGVALGMLLGALGFAARVRRAMHG